MGLCKEKIIFLRISDRSLQHSSVAGATFLAEEVAEMKPNNKNVAIRNVQAIATPQLSHFSPNFPNSQNGDPSSDCNLHVAVC